MVRFCFKCLFLYLVLITPLSANEAQTPIGKAVKDLPIFDAHIHYKFQAWEDYPVSSIIELMDRSGVAMALVSSTPDEGTIKLWEYAPNRVVPEVRPYHGTVHSGNWMKVPDIDAYLEDRLEAYPHEGIGEFHIHSLDVDDEPLFRKVIDLAKARGIYLHVHSDAEPIRWLYGLDPTVKIIWAHAGLGEDPYTIFDLMTEFPDLIADTSLREREILGSDDRITPHWRGVIMTFQDRLMIGSDTWVNGQWASYENIIASHRIWLSQLPRSVAEKVAYKNAERIFGRSISMEQIGTR